MSETAQSPDDWAEYGTPGGEERVIEPTRNGKAQTLRPRLRPWTWAELSELSEPDYLIKHLLDAGCLSVIWGDSGCGKTFFALDLALHVALGRDWRERKVKQGRVVYIAAEAGGSIRKRIDALKLHFGIDNAPLDLIPVTVNLCGDSDPSEIIQQIEATGGAVLVIVDTVSKAMAGFDENSAQDMTAFVENCGKIQASIGAHVCGVHHSGKDKSRGARGHTSFRAATDTAILVEAEANHHLATVDKQRDGIAGEGFAFTLKAITIGTDADGDPVTSCVVIPSDQPPESARRQRLTKNQSTMLSLLEDFGASGATVEDWNDHARQEGLGTTRKANLRDYRAQLRNKKLIHETQGRWYITKC